MDINTQEKPNILKVLIITLFFGALWGILEATLGTLLHLPFFDKFGIYGASTTIIVPIAYVLMANCYKKTNVFYSVIIMGVIASIIKLSTALIIGFRQSVYNPAIYILVEALAMSGALVLFKPKNVLSFRTLGSIILANTIYQFSYLMINMAMGGTNIFASEKSWQLVGEKYLITMNGLAVLYSFFGGLVIYLILKLVSSLKLEVKFDINKILFSPITACLLLVVSIGVNLSLAAL